MSVALDIGAILSCGSKDNTHLIVKLPDPSVPLFLRSSFPLYPLFLCTY